MFDFIKKFLKRWLRDFLTFLALSYFYPGFSINGGISYVISAGLIMAVIEIFFEPLLKMILIPVNIITFGMFSWFLTTLELLIVSYLVKFVEFKAFSFDSFELLGFEIGGMSVNWIFSVVIGTILFNLVSKVLKSLS